MNQAARIHCWNAVLAHLCSAHKALQMDEAQRRRVFLREPLQHQPCLLPGQTHHMRIMSACSEETRGECMQLYLGVLALLLKVCGEEVHEGVGGQRGQRLGQQRRCFVNGTQLLQVLYGLVPDGGGMEQGEEKRRGSNKKIHYIMSIM